MNKATLVAIFIVMNIAVSSAATHGFMNKKTTLTHSEPSVMAQLEEIKNNEFGKKILDTIALQIQNKSPLGDIARMLAEIRQDLVLQEEEADNLHAAQEVECDEEISEFARRIDEAQVARDDAQTEIALLEGEIAVLENDIASKAKQLEILDARDLALREQRESEAFNHAARQAQLAEVLEAIDLIIEKLGGITPDSNNDAVLAQLNKIGKSNPILALAQVASTFNAESLRRVNEKLESLRESLEATVAENDAEEERAISDFENTIGELAVTRKNVATAKSESEGSLAQNEGALALQNNILEEAVEELAASLAGKANKEEVCAEWAATWERNKEVRTNELNLIAKVQNIIATKLDTAVEFLQRN